MPLDILLEGLLFYKAAPLRKKAICEQFGVAPEGLAAAIAALHTRLAAGALRLIETDTEIQLVTSSELAPFLEELRKAELKKDIGKAGAETLAIILYKGSVGRAEIDRIRGVNSSFILRNLLVRGLIERSPAAQGGGYTFSVSTALLAQLGITRTEELADFSRITDALEQFVATEQQETVTEMSA